MTDKLKPCPFCGGEAKVVNNGHGYYWVKCTNNMCLCELSGEETEEEAITAWNKRVKDE